MAYILSVETSTDVCSVAIHQDGSLRTYQLHQVEKSHSSLLPGIVREICEQAGLRMSDLNGIAVSEGPGSYTGLRIGISTAKGFAYALGIPLIAVPTLDIMLEAVRGKMKGQYNLCAMMDARRMEVYLKMEDQDQQEIWSVQPKILDEETFLEVDRNTYLFGNGMPKFRTLHSQENLLFVDDIVPDARNMGQLAFRKFEVADFEDVAYFEPNYLKEWRTTTPKKKVSVKMEEIVNRVAQSPLVSIDLEEYMHSGESIIFDVKDVLYQGLILKEKDFRDFIRSNDWEQYKDKNVGLICSADAIVPTWAYMLLVTKIKEHANSITFGEAEEIEKALVDQAIERCLKEQDLTDKKVVIKGCGAINNVEYAYTRITDKLFDKVSSLMYGEPCSTVPIFKRKK